MIQVWKCDHCSHLTQDTEEMRRHEIKCDWNTKNRTCQTCDFSRGDWDGSTSCSLHLKMESRFGNSNCIKWEEL